MAATCAIATMGLVTPALASTAGPAATSVGAIGAAPMKMVDPITDDSVFISEFHYDNDGTDEGEFIEVQGPVGTDLTGWSLVLYNGSNAPGAAIVYDTDSLPSPIPAAGVVVVDYPANGIQNGDADGIALVDADGVVVEFLSYEGVITGGGGPADGVASTDVGVSEPGSTPIGQSLQRIDGVWTGPLQNSKGAINPADGGGEEPGEPVEGSLGDINANWETYLEDSPRVTTRGVVTAAYPTGGFNGYVIQTEGTGGDTDLSARTASDGIFVYSPGTVEDVAIGDFIEVTGELTEYNGLREISVPAGNATLLTEEFDPVVPIPDFVMPADEADRIVFQNMLVVPSDYVISDTYDLGGWGTNSFGSLLLGHDGPLIQETDVAEVGTAEFDAVAADNAARAVTLDDGRSERTEEGVVPYLSATTHDIRTGVEVAFDQPVVVDYRFQWNFQPTAPQIGAADWLRTTGGETRAANAAPKPVGGDFQIATFNVLNYFTTLGDDVSGCTAYTDREGNPLTVNRCPGNGPRGAWDEANLARQEGKIVDAINGLGAEVVVLQEIENTAATLGDATRESRDDSLALLVEALNADAGAGTWDYVPSPAPDDQPELVDQDVIRPAFIFQPAALDLETETSTILVGSSAFDNAREPEGAVFSPVADPDYAFAVVASHFKSKGGSCGDPAPAEGCFNADRVSQAEAMAAFANSYAVAQDVEDVFLAGDFNSYTMEDPILAFADDGYDVIDNGETSYVYDGKIGSLDHVLANESAMAKVTGSDIWRINAEESVLNEYSRYNYTESDLFQGDNPFRASDHNPAIIGVDAPGNEPQPYTGPIDIYSINDFHGRLEASDYDGGGAEAMACVIDNARADNPDMLFVSGGDNVGASTFVSAVQDDQPTIDVFNEIGLDASAIGNHEFDQGQADLDDRIIPAADWDYLAANIFDGPGEDADHAYQPYVIEEVDGIEIAFIGGITTELHSLVNPDGIEGLDIRNLSESINAVADDLKDDVDLIIPIVHDGANSGDFSDIGDTSFGELLDNADGRFDAVVSGHTHQVYYTDVDGMWVTQTGSYGANLGHLTFDVVDGKVEGNEFEMISLGTAKDPIECDPVTDMPGNVAQIVADAKEEADILGSVPVGEITADFNRAQQSDGSENRGGESTIGNFIADVHLWAGEQAGAQIAFMNPGGIRTDLFYDAREGVTGDADGLVTYQEAAEVQPFANTLMTATFTGEQIIQVLEQQWQPADASRPFLKLGVSDALTYTYDPNAPAGEHITQVWFEGEPLDPAGEYVVIGNSFLMAGGDNFTVLGEGADPADTGRTDLAATVDWFKENEVASPDYRQRAVGISWVTDPGATYGAGDEVTFDVSSWAFSTNEPKPETLTVALGDLVLGTFDVDDTIVDATDEVGRAHVTFILPDELPADSAGLLVLSDELGTTAAVSITLDVGAGGDDNGDDDSAAGGDDTGTADSGGDDTGTADSGGGDSVGAGANGDDGATGGSGTGGGNGAMPDTGVDATTLVLVTLLLTAAGVAIVSRRRRSENGGGLE